MPELPEVETTCRGIAPHVEGRTVTSVIVRDARMRRPVPHSLALELPGEQIERVQRRGKYLLLQAQRGTLLIHLGMSGNLRVIESTAPPRKHDHVDIVFGTRALRYHDPRRFGVVDWWIGPIEAHPLVAPLGIEPLAAAFDGAWLYRATRGRRSAIKLFLMDAHTIVGVGNIYASESLFRAGIRPGTQTGRLSLARCEKLVAAVKETLLAAIQAGGSTLRDFVGSDGAPGYFQHEAYVYGRAGSPCRRCGGPIRQTTLGQRSTFWCPKCQN
ncbi:bifunctional DNA-formamidopyrimidine glycosylase/DNA-(apurinic or apyrimidinic site) lyase [Niveibacterium sp. 24ML]|uniref:bifunctional DNA-formamidopyrimidine glycosylase/DNA-(apurinic or apyrimidinic site) lyase n=1 Tax=Niveibacterium sp. 24ML TaxID=2985512 RepID=UPI002270B786|nr:bifunctional DNA-formamidopyrimidine glycosylase/DNA-(apurinic or apyrimidinic site) lyase [Niveibacterium sp. 24ML]MCX9155564.1 bifunctional DNA-formamidopyrimidine glycosylase/DNA-(apurinic or apyrimidinic site) lyase [Niveibacterium sp. 24ML]